MDRGERRGVVRPGDAVRCRRSRGNADLGLADRRGVVAEVRAGNVRVLLDARGDGSWLANDAVLREADPCNPDLQIIGRILRALAAQRLEFDDDEEELVIFSAEYPADALDEVRALLGPRLLRCVIRAAGVHEVATHLRWRADAGASRAGPTPGTDL